VTRELSAFTRAEPILDERENYLFGGASLERFVIT
jgi:hypothetical protein